MYSVRLYMICTKTGPDIGLIRLSVGIDAHGQIGVRPASRLSRCDRVNALAHDQFGEEPVPACWMG
ncbi:hypothetical protein ATO11_03420 [Pseudaestuariivita atlantica]|uniref:Uncharacterized protein n=1 Tax=Pseudaestuariivita atlantica TaxID=1317121 RepID=A0A0L1JS10_9RHOB|nr:hypothetical protein ATO11_03420 [Pseudaestuariivita atlantica]